MLVSIDLCPAEGLLCTLGIKQTLTNTGCCFFFFLLNIYLAVPGLCCGVQDLWLQSVGSSSQSRIEPGPLHWEQGVLATGPPRKSFNIKFLKFVFSILFSHLVHKYHLF